MRKIFGCTDIGIVRKANQDRFECARISDGLSVAVLCDGMGGANGGHIASDIATRFAFDMLGRDLREDMPEQSVRAVMFSAIAGANALVHEAAAKDPELFGMGTTMIVCATISEILYVAYVGDSRVYCVSPGRELQLSKDHTVVQMLVDMGEISPQDAISHPKRHYITRSVGVSEQVEADFLVHALSPEDIVLLCSDGLYNYLTAGTVYEKLAACDLTESAQPLITLANSSGGADNITAVLAVWRERD